jgi:membrane protein DedA with SNARE-associated domain
MTLEPLIARYGLAALLLGAGLEGETVAAIGGALAHRGTLPWPGVLAAVFAGSFLADQALFALGRWRRDGKLAARLRARPAFARALALLARRPLPFAFGFRFVPGMRTVGPLAIGASGLAPLRFLAINAAAAAIWAGAFVSAGYWLGHGVETLFGRIEPLERLLAPALGAALLLGLAIWLLRRAR